jgi:hypothetical protein
MKRTVSQLARQPDKGFVAGFDSQAVLQRWDNPVPMGCDHFITRAAGGYLGANARHCGADAFWVYIADETAVAFRCHHHKHEAT